MFQGLRDGRIGRVPVWAVGVTIAGAILLFLYFRNRATNAATTGTSSPTDEGLFYDQGQEGVSGLPPGSIGDYLDRDPTNPAYPVGLTPTGIPGPVTNVQWSRLAFDWLVGQGNDPALTERSLSKYLQGIAPTSAEQAVVNLAQRAFGAPPEGLILLPNSPAPTVPDVPVPAPAPAPAPSTSTSRPWIPQEVYVPANTNLYEYAQSLERTYQGWDNLGTIFNKLKEETPDLQWDGSNDPTNKIPYVTSGRTVVLWR